MGISFNAASLLNGNGIDVQSVVNAILSPETGQLTVWQNQQTDYATQAGLLSGYNNNLTSLATAVSALADVNGPLAALTASSSQPGILTATVQTTAVPATHQIVVSGLATIGTVYTDPLTDGNTSFLTGGNTSGDLQLQIGGSGGTTHDIPITQGSNDTLNTLASYINAQNWGVTASVVTDSSGARLALYSQTSGLPGALAITSNTNTSLNFNTPPGAGVNAALTVDGVPYSSPSNTVTGAIAGVTLNLASADSGTPVQLTIGTDPNATTTAVNNFVAAYNAVIGNLNAQFTVDPTTNTEGPLGGDADLRSLQASLLNDVNFSVSGSSGLVNLASLGINLNNDGTLTVDSTQLNTALTANPGAFQNFFQNSSLTGFANNFNSDLTNLTDPTTGILNLDIAENSSQQSALANQISNLQDQLTSQQAALTTQYAQVNATLEAYPLLLQEITAELGAINGTSPNPTIPANTSTTPTTGTSTG